MYVKKQGSKYVLSHGGRILTPEEELNIVTNKSIDNVPLGKYGLDFIKLAYGSSDVDIPDSNSQQIDEHSMVATNNEGGTKGSHETGQNIPVSKDGQQIASVEPGEVIADINGKQVALSKRLPSLNNSFADIYMSLAKQKKDLQSQLTQVQEFDKRGTIERNIDKIDARMAMLPKAQEMIKPKEEGIGGVPKLWGGDYNIGESQIDKYKLQNTDPTYTMTSGNNPNINSPLQPEQDYGVIPTNIIGINTTPTNYINQKYGVNLNKKNTTENNTNSPINPDPTDNTKPNKPTVQDNSNWGDTVLNLVPFAGDLAQEGIINRLSKKRLPLPYTEQIPTLNKDLDISQSEKNIRENRGSMEASTAEGTSSGNVAQARNRAIELSTNDQLGKLYQDKVNFKNEREAQQLGINTEINNRNLGMKFEYDMNEDASIRDIASKQSQLVSKVGEHAMNAINRKDSINYQNKYLAVMEKGFVNVATTLGFVDGTKTENEARTILVGKGYTGDKLEEALKYYRDNNYFKH